MNKKIIDILVHYLSRPERKVKVAELHELLDTETNYFELSGDDRNKYIDEAYRIIELEKAVTY